MKKSKFLLLGSVASLASFPLPFVAAKCGETKEEKKRRNLKVITKNLGGDKNFW
ncbi:variable surface lipoprotein [Mycoplasmopsis bovis]|uniref:variable surface lipoprotein n=1 Tax=Mycoplasmopsis bovis TaxID=28903 RepID=UPI00244EC7FB|nr:variable surface lipoprotein [Mycoplasmopsis bovis]